MSHHLWWKKLTLKKVLSWLPLTIAEGREHYNWSINLLRVIKFCLWALVYMQFMNSYYAFSRLGCNTLRKKLVSKLIYFKHSPRRSSDDSPLFWVQDGSFLLFYSEKTNKQKYFYTSENSAYNYLSQGAYEWVHWSELTCPPNSKILVNQGRVSFCLPLFGW